MSELEEKLNALLSDPNSMAQVMQMAQQLSGAMGEQKAAPPPPPVPPAPDLGAALGGLDPKLLVKLLPLAGNGKQRRHAAAQRPAPVPEGRKARENPTGGTAGAADPCGEEAVGGLGGVAMYNRYIRNDNGVYDRVPQQETAPPSRPTPPPRPDAPPEPGPPPGPEQRPPVPPPAPERQFLNRLLGKLHLGDMDAGDLLLLLILFFLFQQKADEEVLIAIGLLLIL